MPATVRSTSSFIATGSVTTGTVPLPAGWQPGDIFYIVAVLAAATGTITGPGGYTTEAASFHSAASTSASMALFSKKLASGDTAPAVTCTSGRLCCIGVAVQGADQVTWTDVAAASDTNSGVTFPSVRAPSITPVTPGCLLITFHGEYNSSASTGGTFTPDASETEADDQTTTVAAVSDVAVEVAWAQLADTSATGTKTATNSTSGTTTGPMGIAVAVRAAVLAGGGYAQPGQAWLRRFHHRQQLPPPPAAAVAAAVQPVNAAVAMRYPAARRQPRQFLTAGARVPPVAVAPVRQAAARVRRQPPQRVTTGMLPGTGLSGIPPMSAIRPRLVRLPVRPRGAVAGPLAPGAVAAVTPVRVAVLAVPRRGPPRPGRQRITAGMLPGAGLSGIPPAGHIRPRQARAVPPRAVSRILPGQRGSLTVPAPVPVTLRHRQRVLAARSRLIPSPFAPAGVVYQPLTQRTQLIRPAWRLVRQPPQRITAGMLPGRGLSGIPPASFTRLRQAPAVPPRARGNRIAPGAPAVQPVMRLQARLRAVAYRLPRRPRGTLTAGIVPPPPPALQNAASALLVTAPDTSAATVTEPRATAAGARSPHTGGIYTGAYQGTYAPDPAPPGPRATGTPVTGTVTEQGATKPGVSDG